MHLEVYLVYCLPACLSLSWPSAGAFCTDSAFLHAGTIDTGVTLGGVTHMIHMAHCLHPAWLVHCSACPNTPPVHTHIEQLTVNMVHCMLHTLRLGSHGALAQSDSFYHCIMCTLDKSIPMLPKFPCSCYAIFTIGCI